MAKRLLVVDDALIIREMIKDVAKADGWEVVGEADNGKDAIEQFKQLNPDVVTLDLVMPEHDGLHALRGIMSADHNACVLVVSALDQTDILKEALQSGAADFIVKPFDKVRLTNALTKLVARVETPDECSNTR